jgi:hypothetical protein
VTQFNEGSLANAKASIKRLDDPKLTLRSAPMLWKAPWPTTAVAAGSETESSADWKKEKFPTMRRLDSAAKSKDASEEEEANA